MKISPEENIFVKSGLILSKSPQNEPFSKLSRWYTLIYGYFKYRMLDLSYGSIIHIILDNLSILYSRSLYI